MHFLLSFRNALPLADIALVFRHLASPKAARTRARRCEVAKECVASLANIALAVARTPRCALRSLFSARAVACSAHANFSDEHSAFCTEHRFTKRKFNIN